MKANGFFASQIGGISIFELFLTDKRVDFSCFWEQFGHYFCDSILNIKKSKKYTDAFCKQQSPGSRNP
jgi:hypothetical protein